jgi:GGDEF domain-containing protein
LGGDEFALLAVETDGDGAQKLQGRLEAAFAAAGVAVSIGSAGRGSRGPIHVAIEHADTKMYARKAARKRDLAPCA